ncbi:ATP-binding cassette domain-containing protein [Salipiger sp. P9]|uniref:ABC transporter ATP-binding protein n=1 Tax=Salipiger pentaromativorans TaxID=2943193 RepID=UPI0021577265|nr:oligopeptide/dipeptide ABC transporter ATP-binding protein [Salipiger pentaromativorans]MCR8548868.1 ATP-binding cassette domain-containing protein [Salipiger pentaromativorans]
MTESPVLSVRDLRKDYDIRGRGRRRTLTAVDGVSFDVYPGETVAIVGESGSGKSTIARCVTRLTEPTSGAVTLAGTPVLELSARALPAIYRDLQMVFQDPNSSLDPLMRVRDLLDEPLRLHTKLDKAARAAKIAELLRSVDLPEDMGARLPHQLSGGQRQRIGIARALAVDPKVIVLDEPTASLDVSIRGQIIRLLKRLQAEQGIAYVLISHDLAVVRRISDRVLVMYLGKTVEEGSAKEIFEAPAHPYTRALLSAAPKIAFGESRTRLKLEGEIPSPVDLPPGCRLAGRCPLAWPDCRRADPPLLPIGGTHRAACPVTVQETQRA